MRTRKQIEQDLQKAQTKYETLQRELSELDLQQNIDAMWASLTDDVNTTKPLLSNKPFKETKLSFIVKVTFTPRNNPVWSNPFKIDGYYTLEECIDRNLEVTVDIKPTSDNCTISPDLIDYLDITISEVFNNSDITELNLANIPSQDAASKIDKINRDIHTLVKHICQQNPNKPRDEVYSEIKQKLGI